MLTAVTTDSEEAPSVPAAPVSPRRVESHAAEQPRELHLRSLRPPEVEGCADLPGLLETSGITEYEVILIRDRPRGWQVRLTNSERSDPSQSEGCPFISLQRGY